MPKSGQRPGNALPMVCALAAFALAGTAGRASACRCRSSVLRHAAQVACSTRRHAHAWCGSVKLVGCRCPIPPSRLKKYSPDSKPIQPRNRRPARFFHMLGFACSTGRFRSRRRPLLHPLSLNAPPAHAPVPIAPGCACAPGCRPPSSARTSGPRAQGLAPSPVSCRPRSWPSQSLAL